MEDLHRCKYITTIYSICWLYISSSWWCNLTFTLVYAVNCIGYIASYKAHAWALSYLHYTTLLWKLQCTNVLSHAHFILYTQNNEFILNALLECIKFLIGTHIGNVLLVTFCYRNWTMACMQGRAETTIWRRDLANWLYISYIHAVIAMCNFLNNYFVQCIASYIYMYTDLASYIASYVVGIMNLHTTTSKYMHELACRYVVILWL